MNYEELTLTDKLYFLRTSSIDEKWENRLKEFKDEASNHLNNLLKDFNSSVLQQDVKIFNQLYEKLSPTCSLASILDCLEFGRIDLLKTINFPDSFQENPLKTIISGNNPLLQFQNYLLFLERPAKDIDFIAFTKSFGANTPKDSTYISKITQLFMFFRQKLNNTIFVDDNHFTLLEYFYNNSSTQYPLSFEKDLMNDAYLNTTINRKYLKNHFKSVLFHKLDSDALQEISFLYLERINSTINSATNVEILTAFKNLECIAPLFHKFELNYSLITSFNNAIKKIGEHGIYFLYMDLKHKVDIVLVEDMVAVLNLETDILQRYITASGYQGLISGNNIENELKYIDNEVALFNDSSKYHPSFNFLTQSFEDNTSNNIIQAMEPLLTTPNYIERLLNGYLTVITNLLNAPNKFSEFSSFSTLISKKHLLKPLITKDKISVPNNDEMLLYSNESKELFLSETMETSESIITSYVKKIESNYFSQVRSVSKSHTLLKSIDVLYNNFPNFEKVTEYIEDMLKLQTKGNGMFYIPPLILAGPPGVGKTFYLSELTSLANTFMRLISYQNVTANFILIGNSSKWSGGGPGLIFNTLMNTKCKVINPIIVLDEIDKNGSGSNYSTEDCLLGLLEKYTAQEFIDECINLKIDASHISWLATANNISNISLPLQNRFDIIDIPSPNMAQKRLLVQNIYSNVLKTNIWGNAMHKELPQYTIDKMVDILNYGVSRDLRKIIVTACSKAVKHDNNILLPDYIDFKEPQKMPWDA